MDEINERRDRLKKVETSLNEKEENRKEVDREITEAENVYEQVSIRNIRRHIHYTVLK